jgi:SAM-dependent methyltransferase
MARLYLTIGVKEKILADHDQTLNKLHESWDFVYRRGDVFQLPWVEKMAHPKLRSSIDKLPLKSGRALDIGCGIGQAARYMAQVGFEVCAIDVSWEAISIAKKVPPVVGNVRYVVGNSIYFHSPVMYNLVVDFLHLHDIQKGDLEAYAKNILSLTNRDSYVILAFLSDKDPTNPPTGERNSHFVDFKVHYHSVEFICGLFSTSVALVHSETIKVGRGNEEYLANLVVFKKVV